ncbi:MAG TPA: RHS repeat-associated core domain-containing protein, partial [Verrucomicrobiae bacterium]|nr:RHS repeat-associated core domain-containing protein [Verrucomicrobiae bacterium]
QELPGAPTTAFYHADGNGNITALMYPNQQLAAKYLYDPFGNMLAMSGPLVNFNKYRFSSKEWNDNSGLYYYLYRFYDAGLQRWPNRDPLSNQGFMVILKRHPIDQFAQVAFTAVGDDSHTGIYDFVNSDPIYRYDYLGLDNCKPPCTSAPPLPSSSSACDAYGNGTYMGDSLTCFCQCAGDSPWAQQVRGCLACEFQQGTDISTAHQKCYAAAGGIMNGPVLRLWFCWVLCSATPPVGPPGAGMP